MSSAAACDSITGSSAHPAREARVRVTGTSSVPLTLTTSTDFTAQTDQTTGETVYTLNTFRTDTIAIPLDHIFQFNGSDRFFVRLTNSDPNVTATVRMQVLIDGKSLYDVPAALKDASLKFSYFSL